MADRKAPVRGPKEAWAMAYEYRKLMFRVVNQYVRRHRASWYNQEALKRELESYGWEGLFRAASHFEEDDGRATFSTYAWKVVSNELNRGYRQILRMGGNFKGAKRTMDLPYLGSIEAIDQYNDFDFADGVADWVPQPWQEEEDYEALMTDRDSDISEARLIRELVEDMEEPYRSVMLLIHFTDPPERNNNNHHMTGNGLTYTEAAEVLGMSKTRVMDIVHEAHEYLAGHVEAIRGSYEKD